ncbi:hypothetical protein BKA62DRAFT_767540 [Auriculariales sp. MPI-PUGE-AT-0066]|nr:hypothetical protein BKA62DRAFT_767540 [Auriculariales sp. MPI-PUGE-AT-0066]
MDWTSTLTITARLVATLLLTPAVFAIRVAYPTQQQLPPVARAGQAFSWTLRPDTFSPQPASVKALNLPQWLSFDSTSLSFSGTSPTGSYVGGLPTVDIVATDADGRHVTDSIDLYLSSRPAPIAAHPIQSQLRPNAPPLASVFLLSPGSALAASPESTNGTGFENGLRVPPAWSFSIGWRHDTFEFPPPDQDTTIHYAARLSNGDPLPDWLIYNTTALTFNGVAPKVTTPLRLAIALIGGDAPGYLAIQDRFSLTVAAHELSIEPESFSALKLPVNISASSPIVASFAVPTLLLDGDVLPSDAARNTSFGLVSGPEWLALDAASHSLTGTPPINYTGTMSVIVSVGNPAAPGQTITTPIDLVVTPSMFTSPQLPTAWVKPGKLFTYDLGSFIIPSAHLPDDSLVMRTDSNADAWLTFDAKKRVVSGMAPKSLSSNGDIVVNATFQSADAVTHAVSQTRLSVIVSENPHTDSRTGPTGYGDSHQGKNGPGGVSRSIIALIVGSLLAFIVLCILAACCRRFCAARDGLEDEESGSIHQVDFEAAMRRHSHSSATGVGKNEKAKMSVASVFSFLTGGKKDIPSSNGGLRRSTSSGQSEGFVTVPLHVGLPPEEQARLGYKSPPERWTRKVNIPTQGGKLLAYITRRGSIAPSTAPGVPLPVTTSSSAQSFEPIPPASVHQNQRFSRLGVLPGEESEDDHHITQSQTMQSFGSLNRQARDPGDNRRGGSLIQQDTPFYACQAREEPIRRSGEPASFSDRHFAESRSFSVSVRSDERSSIISPISGKKFRVGFPVQKTSNGSIISATAFPALSSDPADSFMYYDEVNYGEDGINSDEAYDGLGAASRSQTRETLSAPPAALTRVPITTATPVLHTAPAFGSIDPLDSFDRALRDGVRLVAARRDVSGSLTRSSSVTPAPLSLPRLVLRESQSLGEKVSPELQARLRARQEKGPELQPPLGISEKVHPTVISATDNAFLLPTPRFEALRESTATVDTTGSAIDCEEESDLYQAQRALQLTRSAMVQ